MSYWQAYRKVLKVNSLFTLAILGIAFIVGLVGVEIDKRKGVQA
jgi:hypothetical protein